MRRVEALTDGAVSMGPGTLYGSIKRMLADGLIEETAERPDPELDDERRQYYRVTADGEQARRRARPDGVAPASCRLAAIRRRVMRSVRIYRALARLYPPSFRRAYGDLMVQQFVDRLRRDGGRRAWGCACAT